MTPVNQIVEIGVENAPRTQEILEIGVENNSWAQT